MVGPISRCLNDDAPLDTERLMNAQGRFPGRGWHLVGRAGAHWILVERSQHMELAVAAFWRRRFGRAPRIRIERKISRHCKSPSLDHTSVDDGREAALPQRAAVHIQLQ